MTFPPQAILPHHALKRGVYLLGRSFAHFTAISEEIGQFVLDCLMLVWPAGCTK